MLAVRLINQEQFFLLEVAVVLADLALQQQVLGQDTVDQALTHIQLG
jgi:hypothetical protein